MRPVRFRINPLRLMSLPMMSPTIFDPHAIRRSFNRAARQYESVDWLQWEVAQRLMEQPQLLEAPQRGGAPWEQGRIVDAGCGTGRISAWLKQRWPKAQVIGVDWAPGMLHQARRRSRWRRNLDLICADLGQLPLPAQSVDLLVCSLALQWCDDIPSVLNRWRRVLKPGGLLLFSSFGPATLSELREAWSAVDQGSHVSPFVELQQLGDWLLSSGYRDPVMSAEVLQASYAEPRSLMQELKTLGAHNGTLQRPRGLTGKQSWQRLNQAYPRQHDGRILASWEVLYGAAWGPPEGQPVRHGQGEVATFSVEALRRSKRSE